MSTTDAASESAVEKVVFHFELKASTPGWRGERPNIDNYVKMIQKRLDYGSHSGVSVRPTGPTTFDVAITDRATLPTERIIRRVVALGYFWIAPLANEDDDSAALTRARLAQGQSVMQDGLEMAGWVPLGQRETSEELTRAGVVMRAFGENAVSALRWKTVELITSAEVCRVDIDTLREHATALHVSLSADGRRTYAELTKFFLVGTEGYLPRYVGFEYDGSLIGCTSLEAKTPDVLTFRTNMPIDEAEDMVAVVMGYQFLYPAKAIGWSVPSIAQATKDKPASESQRVNEPVQ